MSKQRAARLVQARKSAGFETASEAAESLGVAVSTYLAHEKGQDDGGRNFKEDSARHYARRFGVTYEWLWLGITRENLGVPVVGRVAAGVAEFEDMAPMGGADEYLPTLNAEGRIALKVQGDSMTPLARDGDYAVFGPRQDDPSALIGRRVMARLKDRRKLFKILRRGSQPGLYSLFSLNDSYDPIEDVELEWALPLEWLHVR